MKKKWIGKLGTTGLDPQSHQAVCHPPLSCRRRWSTWEPSFPRACVKTKRFTKWSRRRERERESPAAAWGMIAPAACRLYRRSVRSVKATWPVHSYNVSVASTSLVWRVLWFIIYRKYCSRYHIRFHSWFIWDILNRSVTCHGAPLGSFCCTIYHSCSCHCTGKMNRDTA